MGGFRFRSSLKKWKSQKVFAARVFGLRPNTCRPVADETKLTFARVKKPLVPRERGKRKEERGKRKEERGKRKLKKFKVSQNMVSFSEPSENQTLNLRSIKCFKIA